METVLRSNSEIIMQAITRLAVEQSISSQDMYQDLLDLIDLSLIVELVVGDLQGLKVKDIEESSWKHVFDNLANVREPSRTSVVPVIDCSLGWRACMCAASIPHIYR